MARASKAFPAALAPGVMIRRRPSVEKDWGPAERIVQRVATCVTDLGLPFEDVYWTIEIETDGGRKKTIIVRTGMIGRTIQVVDG